MSMHEALRKLRNVVPWLSELDSDAPEAPAALTPIEAAESLLRLAQTPGIIDRHSETWRGVARWAATELISAQLALESATGDRATAIRGATRILRDVLAIDERTELKAVVEDQEPFVP